MAFLATHTNTTTTRCASPLARSITTLNGCAGQTAVTRLKMVPTLVFRLQLLAPTIPTNGIFIVVRMSRRIFYCHTDEPSDFIIIRTSRRISTAIRMSCRIFIVIRKSRRIFWSCGRAVGSLLSCGRAVGSLLSCGRAAGIGLRQLNAE